SVLHWLQTTSIVTSGTSLSQQPVIQFHYNSSSLGRLRGEPPKIRRRLLFGRALKSHEISEIDRLQSPSNLLYYKCNHTKEKEEPTGVQVYGAAGSRWMAVHRRRRHGMDYRRTGDLGRTHWWRQLCYVNRNDLWIRSRGRSR